MSTAERIIQKLTELRPEKQSEVLEFVEFLQERENREEEKMFKHASLATAMRGLEDEEELYTEADFVEKLS